MNISLRTKDQTFVFSLDGSLDIYTSLDLKTLLEDQVKNQNPEVCINLDQLTYIDSSGIGILIKALNYVQALGGNMCVANLKPAIEKVFKVSGLTNYFEIVSPDEYSARFTSV